MVVVTMVADENAETPAYALTGITLDGEWRVDQLLTKPAFATGGTFSASYTVEQATSGRRAFLKAIDYVEALQSQDPPRTLQTLTENFNFERDIVQACSQGRLSRIVRAIDSGSVEVSGFPIPRVSYLIFELADGDIRRYRARDEDVDLAWALRSMHGVALGVSQLHSQGIAHQDLKPSNVMTFGDDISKIGDFGRAFRVAGWSPFDDLHIAGDLRYAPPELFYGYLLPSWDRRRACDAYHVGSLLLFQLTDISATHALFAHLDPEVAPTTAGGGFTGSYDQALPYLRDALWRVSEQIPELDDPELRNELLLRFRELCDPDPARRGHPKAKIGSGNPWAMERYVSRFDALARRAATLRTRITLP